MNKEEKKVVELLQHCQNTYIEDTLVTRLQLTTKEAKILLNLVEKQQKEIEKLKEDYQILKDDIEEHRIIYVDTPEFEENYISKDKIKEKIKKEKEMRYYRFLYGNNQTPLESYKFKYTEIDMNDYAGMEVNRALKELLVSGQESDQEGGQEE